MNNTCSICRSTIDNQWSSLQNYIKSFGISSNLLSTEFITRCIYCYKSLLELSLKSEHQLYVDVVKAIEKRNI